MPPCSSEATAIQGGFLGEFKFTVMNGAVDENCDGTVEWQALEAESLGACSTCMPASSDGQQEAEGQLLHAGGGSPQHILQTRRWCGSDASHAVDVEGCQKH